MKRYLIPCALAIALSLTAVAAQAEGWSTTAFAGFDRDPLDRELRGEGRQLRLEDRFTFGLATERSFAHAPGRETVLGFGLSRELYPDATEGDRLRFDASAEHRIELAGDRASSPSGSRAATRATMAARSIPACASAPPIAWAPRRGRC